MTFVILNSPSLHGIYVIENTDKSQKESTIHLIIPKSIQQRKKRESFHPATQLQASVELLRHNRVTSFHTPIKQYSSDHLFKRLLPHIGGEYVSMKAEFSWFSVDL